MAQPIDSHPDNYRQRIIDALEEIALDGIAVRAMVTELCDAVHSELARTGRTAAAAQFRPHRSPPWATPKPTNQQQDV